MNNYLSKLKTGDLLKDNLNLPPLDNFNELNTYDFLNSPELSEETKAYLSTYTSNTRPELNDYTKAYLNSLEDTSNEARPELSNLTKEYLLQNSGNDDKKEEEEDK